jgi:hypothetical protein
MKTVNEIIEIAKKLSGNFFVLILILAVFIPASTYSQVDKNKNEYQKEFDKFKKNIQDDFDSFKSKNDSIFIKFLEETWKEFDLFIDKRPTKPKPVIQPQADTISTSGIELVPFKKNNYIEDLEIELQPIDKPEKYQTIDYAPEPPNTIATFDFYGSELNIPYDPLNLPSVKSVSKEGIATFYCKAAKNDNFLYTIKNVYDNARQNNLNGWGFLQLLKSVSSNLYDNINDQILFTWFALLKSGYEAKVGYVDNMIYLLVVFDMPVYNKSYFEANDKRYYLIPFGKQENFKSSVIAYEADYPGELDGLSLILKEVPDIGSKNYTKSLQYKQDDINISINKYLIDFYKSYPDCMLYVYFSGPLSEIALQSLDNYFLPHLKNKTEFKKVELLLNFVQHSIPYKIDEQQFGCENYLFAEETLFYPFADCEDRAILLSRLINRYTDLQAIGLDYPEHVSLGVRLFMHLNGNFIIFEKNKYYICDPTYLGAKIGMAMDFMKYHSPVIVEVPN